MEPPAVEIVLVQQVVFVLGQFPQRAVQFVHITIGHTIVSFPSIQEIADALRRVSWNLEIPVLRLLDFISLDYAHDFS